MLTDFEYTIISVLRPRTDQEADVKFNVREKYPLELVKQNEPLTKEKWNYELKKKTNLNLIVNIEKKNNFLFKTGTNDFK